MKSALVTPATAGVLFLLALAWRGLIGARWHTDTGWYAAIATEILRRGDWWTLHADGAVFTRKPPLAFWIHAAAFDTLGVNPLTLQVPTLIFAALCVVLTAAVALKLAGPRAALWSALAVGATVEFARTTDRIRLDYPHLCFMLAAVLAVALIRPASRRSPPQAALAAAAGIAIGAALLTKPIFSIYTLPVLAGWMLWTRRRHLVPWLLLAGGAAVLVAAPWHAAMLNTHSGFAASYFGYESAERAVTGTNHVQPWWWYLRFLAVVGWPWLAIIVLAVWRHLHNPQQHPTQLKAEDRTPHAGAAETTPQPAKDLFRLAVVWIAAWLVALSVFADKRSGYALVLYPGLAWLTAWAVITTPWRGWLHDTLAFIERRALPLAAAALAAALALTPLLAATLRPAPEGWHDLVATLRTQTAQPHAARGFDYNDRAMLAALAGPWLPDEHQKDAAQVVLIDLRHAQPEPNERVIWNQGDFALAQRLRPPPEAKPAQDSEPSPGPK